MNRTLYRLTQAVGLLAVGAVFGYASQTPSPTITQPDNVASCEGGTQTNLQMAITPIAVESTKRGETLVLGIDVQSRFETKAAARIALELVDDRGEPQMKTVESERMILRPGTEGMQTLELKTPEHLEDGFYKLTATGAALTTNGESAENIVQMYLQRERGEFFSLDYEEYVTKSHALMEVAVQ